MTKRSREPLPVGSRADLELVGDRADDRDPEAAFVEARPPSAELGLGVEALAVVGDLDHEPVGLELVDDLDQPSPSSP